MHRNGVTRMRQMHKIQQKVEQWGTQLQNANVKIQRNAKRRCNQRKHWLVGWMEESNGGELRMEMEVMWMNMEVPVKV